MTENNALRRSIDPSTSPIRPVKRRKSCAESKQDKQLTRKKRELPARYIDCERLELITIISRMLSSIVKANDELTVIDVKYLSNENLTRFHSRSPPQISIYNYLLRLAHYSSLENCVLIVTVYYIDLLTKKYPSFALNSLTVHRFLLTATTIASKALCDSFCSNQHYAKVGGVNIIELNLLEVEFLKWVNYRVVPRDFNYDSFCERRNSSTGSVEINTSNALKYGISTAHKILDLYYEKMIGLVGGIDSEYINVGVNDDTIYLRQQPKAVTNPTTRSTSSASTSSSSTTSSSASDEYEDSRYPSPMQYNHQSQSTNVVTTTTTNLSTASYPHIVSIPSETVQPNAPLISQQSPHSM